MLRGERVGYSHLGAVGSYLADVGHPLDHERVSSREELLRKASVVANPALHGCGFGDDASVRGIKHALAPLAAREELDDNFDRTCGTRAASQSVQRGRGKSACRAE